MQSPLTVHRSLSAVTEPSRLCTAQFFKEHRTCCSGFSDTGRTVTLCQLSLPRRQSRVRGFFGHGGALLSVLHFGVLIQLPSRQDGNLIAMRLYYRRYATSAQFECTRVLALLPCSADTVV
jgi:hypothetical protein